MAKHPDLTDFIKELDKYVNDNLNDDRDNCIQSVIEFLSLRIIELEKKIEKLEK